MDSSESAPFLTNDIARADAPACSCGSDSAGCGDSGCGGCGDSGGGGKLICTELFRQGLLNPAWYEADERFGKLVPSSYSRRVLVLGPTHGPAHAPLAPFHPFCGVSCKALGGADGI